MNQRDLAEIKRRLNPDKRNPSLICGCYVDHIGNPITSFELPVSALYEQENEKYMSIFKKVLSGQIGQNLTPIAYPTESDDLLLRVRDTALNDPDSLQALFTRLIAGIRAEHPDMQSVEDAQNAENWLILLMHDDLDVRKRDVNGEIDYDNSDRAFSYFLCAVCPVKQDKPALRYLPADGVFHERSPEWLASAPALGFLFPLYEDGAADVNTILFFSKDSNDAHADFLKAAFNVEAEMPAAEQTDHFQTLLAQSLGTDCSLDVVQEMHEAVSGLIEEHPKDDEPLTLSKQDVARMLGGTATAFASLTFGSVDLDVRASVGGGRWLDRGRSYEDPGKDLRLVEDWRKNMDYRMLPRLGMGGTFTYHASFLEGLTFQVDTDWLRAFKRVHLGGKNRNVATLRIGYHF